MNLTYQAIAKQGHHVTDCLDAPTVQDGVEVLRKQGLFVTHIVADKDGTTSVKDRQVKAAEMARMKLPLSQLILFTRQMAMLLTSGSALVPALTAIAAQMKSPIHQRMIALIKENLEQGVSLTDALRAFPKSFNASYCAIVAAGESSATLPKMFARLTTLINKRRSIRNKIFGAMVYPVLLIFMSISIMGVIMFFVIPRFAGMFETLNVELPTSTKLMMAMATGLKQYWPFVILALASVVGGMIWLVKTDFGQQLISNWQIRIPLAGRLMSRLIQGQTFRILGMLLEVQVGLLEAMNLARGVTRNDRFQTLYDDLDDSVTRGESVSAAMERTSLINPSIIQAIRTGEQSGRLGESISYVADILDEENTELLSTITKLIEPLVLIVLGAVVGTVSVSLFMPLFDMTAAI